MALSVVLGASLGISPLWAIAAESDVEQTLRDYQQRLEKLEQQQVESSLTQPERLRINGFLSAGMSRAEADTTLGDDGHLYTSPSPRDRTRSRMPASA